MSPPKNYEFGWGAHFNLEQVPLSSEQGWDREVALESFLPGPARGRADRNPRGLRKQQLLGDKHGAGFRLLAPG